MTLCLSVMTACSIVYKQPVLTDWAGSYTVLWRNSGTSKHKGTNSLWNFVPNSTPHTSFVTTCCQLCSTQVNAQCDQLNRRRSNYADNTGDGRHSTSALAMQFITLSVHLSILQDAREAAHRAGPSATADICTCWTPSWALCSISADTHTHLTALLRDYPGEPIPER